VLSHWETGDRTPKPERVAQILATLDVNGERYARIMTLAYGTNESKWITTTLPEQRQQMVAILDGNSTPAESSKWPHYWCQEYSRRVTTSARS